MHFAVTREYAEREVHEFNVYYDAQDAEVQEAFGNKHSSLHNYEFCDVCMGHDFYLTPEEDMIRGITLNPVICEDF